MQKNQLIKEYNKLNDDYRLLLEKEIDMSQELLMLKQTISKQNAENKDVKQMHENTRKLKHDMRNHLMVIAMFLGSEKYNDAKDYTSKILDKLNLDYSYINSGNSLLNYILNMKIKVAQDKKIYIKIEVENLKFSKMDSIDFSAVFGNILDNAICGAEQSKKKELYVAVLQKRGYDTILVKNTIDHSVLGINPELNSTKDEPEKHGVGIKQIKMITEKYNGLTDIYEENNMFCMSVMIPS